MRKVLLVFFLILFLDERSFAAKKIDTKLKSFVNFEEVLKTSNIWLGNLVVFSSRDYITQILKSRKNKPETIYWVLPVEEFKKEDVNLFLEHMKENFKIEEVKTASEGLYIRIDNVDIYVLLTENVGTVDTDINTLILDVDYFLRRYKNDVKTPKMEMIVNTFQIFNEYKWDIKQIFVVKSLDINLPDWVQEFSFATEKIYKLWQKNVYPKEYLALDYIDQAFFYFAQYEDAYNLLKTMEKFHADNPYYYQRLFWGSLKNFKEDDILFALRKAYELDSKMIYLCIEGAQYLMEKGEYYPAYALVNEGLKKEPWNSKLKDMLKQIVELGYEYYNTHEGFEELFDFFKKEKEKMGKR